MNDYPTAEEELKTMTRRFWEQVEITEKAQERIQYWTDVAADSAERIAALEEVAERYNKLKNMAVKKTAYDRYGDGCHWSIGFFSDDYTMSFDDAVDEQAI